MQSAASRAPCSNYLHLLCGHLPAVAAGIVSHSGAVALGMTESIYCRLRNRHHHQCRTPLPCRLGPGARTGKGCRYVEAGAACNATAEASKTTGLTAAGSGALAVIGTVVVWATEKRTTDLQYKIPLAVQVVCIMFTHRLYKAWMTDGASQVFPGLLCILSLFLTESPFLLLSKGNHERARQNLVLLRGGNVQLAEAELKMQELAIASSAEQAKSQQKWTNMFNRKNFERSLTASAFISVSQVCGQALAGGHRTRFLIPTKANHRSTGTYSTVILVQSGVGDAFQITILIFTLQFFGTLVGPFLM